MVIIDESGFVPAWVFKLATKRKLKALRSKTHRKFLRKSKKDKKWKNEAQSIFTNAATNSAKM